MGSQIPGDVSRLIYSYLLPSLQDCNSFALTSKEIYIATVSNWPEQKINRCLDLWFNNQLSPFYSQHVLHNISSTVPLSPHRLQFLSQDQLEMLFSRTSFGIRSYCQLEEMEALIHRDNRIVSRLTELTISPDEGILSLDIAQKINNLAGSVKKRVHGSATSFDKSTKEDQLPHLFENIVELNLSACWETSITPLIIEYCPNLTELTINQNYSVGEVVLPPQLKRLEINNCFITSTWLEMVLSKCPSLDVLKISSCIAVDGQLDLKDIPPQLQLSSFIATDSGITLATLVKLISNSPKLEFLSILNYNDIIDFDLEGAPQLLKLREVYLNSVEISSGLGSLLSRTPNLEKLKVSDCSSSILDLNLDNGPLLQRLHTVEFRDTTITSTALKSVLVKSPNLETLVVSCYRITSLDLSDISSFPKLTSLEAQNCNEGILNLIGKCTNLSNLHIVKCQPLREEVVPVLPKLTYLHLQQLKFDSFAFLLAKTPNLQHLDLSICTSEGIPSSAIPSLPHLKSLMMERFDYAQGDLQVLLTKCNNIESVNLRASEIEEMPPLPQLTKLQVLISYDGWDEFELLQQKILDKYPSIQSLIPLTEFGSGRRGCR
jgi:hypothetical protein